MMVDSDVGTVRRFCHASRPEHALSILQDGLRPSSHGRLSAGIYLTDDNCAAACIARHRAAGGKDCVVIDVEVDLGHVKDLGHGSDTAGSWRHEGYDACQSIHPPWAGSGAFTEYCIADASRVRVVGSRRLYAWLRDGGGWNSPQHYETIRTVAIGQRLFVFGRGSNEIHLASFDTVSQGWSSLPGLSWLKDSDGWNKAKHYETIRVTPIAEHLFVTGRGSTEIHLARFDTTVGTWSLLPSLPWLGDGHGWDKPQYYNTIRVVSIGCKLFVFARGHFEIHLACFDTATESWALLPGLKWLSSKQGWDNPEFYETIRVVPIGGKLCIFGRGKHELHLAIFDTVGGSWSILKGMRWLSDADGWNEPQYYRTIRVIASREKLYVFGRGAHSIHLASFDTISNAWETLPELSWLEDSEGWNAPQYYETIRIVPIGEKLFVLGRGNCEVHLASFDTARHTWALLPGFPWLADAAGWSDPKMYGTIEFGCIEQKAFLFGRGADHIHLAFL